jgi:molecular chaperone DnaK
MGQPPVGIDLGTTYSTLAVINPAGRPEIVPNADGERVTASAVYFEEGGPIVVGQDAVAAVRAYPDRVVRWIKREIGSPGWSFTVDGRSYSAIEISAMVLKKLKQDAEKTVGPIEHAVITVPAYFDEVRRRATIEAGRLAGLNVLRIINEPTAAAIAYASAGGDPCTMLVYDFGGGTFDASIVTIQSELEVKVIASDGDHALGGHDLDLALARHYNQELARDKGIEIDEASGDWLGVIEDAERDKRYLSKRPSVKGRVQWGAHLVTVDVERAQFEGLIKDYTVRTKMLIENVLEQASYSPGDIDSVLLVGGSTRIPAVRRMLAEMFRCPVVQDISPDEAVALGAAIQAGAIMREQGIGDLTPEAGDRMDRTVISDVTPHSFGTIVVDMESGFSADRGSVRERNTFMIPKNTPLSAVRKETFYTVSDEQRSVECQVTQGEDTDPHFVRIIVTGDLELPEGLPANSPIEVTYSYNLNGCMECVFREPSTGKSREFRIAAEDIGAPQKAPDQQEIDFDDLFIE